MVFAAIGWHGFLVLNAGFEGGRESRAVTKTLARRPLIPLSSVRKDHEAPTAPLRQ
jgi:hypothetical protein